MSLRIIAAPETIRDSKGNRIKTGAANTKHLVESCCFSFLVRCVMAGLRIIKKAGKYHSAAGRCKHILQIYLIKTG